MAKIIVGADEPYQQQDNQSITIRNFQNEKFLIDYSLRLKNWDITSEEVTINGFKCFKAINKIKNNRSGNENTITAWFSPDIPASYGPLGFGGLPGLIVELDYKYCIFKLEKLTLNLEDIKVEIMENYPLISAEEYVSKIRSSRMVTPD